MAVDLGYGIDTSVLDGTDQVLDDTFNEINGIEVLGQDVYKALSSPSNPVVLVIEDAYAAATVLTTDELALLAPAPPTLFPLLFWENPSVSWDLRDRLNDSVSPADIAYMRALIERIYLQDLRFQWLVSFLAFNGEGRTIVARVDGQASGVPLRLVLTANSNQITVEQIG